MLTDNRLKIFVAVAQNGGFTAAARSLKMSQPAVSQCIAQLETEAGEALFVRGKNSVTITEKGRLFYAYALRILSLYDSLDAEISGAEALPERTRLPLGDGREADICIKGGKIEIEVR